MSIKIKASFTTEKERARLERLLLPLKASGARIKVVSGRPYSRIYMTLEEGGEACRPPPGMVK